MPAFIISATVWIQLSFNSSWCRVAVQRLQVNFDHVLTSHRLSTSPFCFPCPQEIQLQINISRFDILKLSIFRPYGPKPFIDYSNLRCCCSFSYLPGCGNYGTHGTCEPLPTSCSCPLKRTPPSRSTTIMGDQEWDQSTIGINREIYRNGNLRAPCPWL